MEKMPYAQAGKHVQNEKSTQHENNDHFNICVHKYNAYQIYKAK